MRGGGRGGEGVYVDIGGEGNEELETAHVGGGWRINVLVQEHYMDVLI